MYILCICSSSFQRSFVLKIGVDTTNKESFKVQITDLSDIFFIREPADSMPKMKKFSSAVATVTACRPYDQDSGFAFTTVKACRSSRFRVFVPRSDRDRPPITPSKSRA